MIQAAVSAILLLNIAVSYSCNTNTEPEERCGIAHVDATTLLPLQCDPRSSRPCCSALGHCSGAREDCACDTCVDTDKTPDFCENWNKCALFNGPLIGADVQQKKDIVHLANPWTTTDWQGCAYACRDVSGCEFFSWTNERFSKDFSSMCYLKNNSTIELNDGNIFFPKENVVSGYINRTKIDYKDMPVLPTKGLASVLVPILVPVVLIFLLLLLLLLIFICYKETILIWVYSQGWLRFLFSDELMDADKPYDVFISYSHHDAQFVNQVLLPGLESPQDLSNKYKCLTHEKDWLAGQSIPENIITSVQSSRRTLIVLSQDFIGSMWSKLEFRAAHTQALHDKTQRVVIIVRGNLPPENEMEEDLKKYISLNTYIESENPWFWQRLRYALPHRSGGFLFDRQMPRCRQRENHLDFVRVQAEAQSVEN